MATVTLSTPIYNEAKNFAQRQNQSVDEFIVTLIHNHARQKREFQMKSVNELEPVLQDILSMPVINPLDEEDVNGDKARWEYYKEKYEL